MTSSTQTVRNVITISTPAPHSLLGWRRAQLSHLPAQAIIQRSLGIAPVTVLCRASWVVAPGHGTRVGSQQRALLSV